MYWTFIVMSGLFPKNGHRALMASLEFVGISAKNEWVKRMYKDVRRKEKV